jgi:hypothetical protein
MGGKWGLTRFSAFENGVCPRFSVPPGLVFPMVPDLPPQFAKRQKMVDESATTTFIIPENFEQTAKLLRKALPLAKLTITGELNMSERIRKALLVGTPPCLVLFASPAEPIVASGAADPCGALIAPFHIVVSARGAQTEVHILRALPRDDGPLVRETRDGLARLQSAISQAVSKIGMRSNLGV